MSKTKKKECLGVYYDKKGKKYRAQISFFGKKIRCGSYQTEREAVEARQKLLREYNPEDYKEVALDYGLALFVMKHDFKYESKSDELNIFRLLYQGYAVPSLLIVFANYAENDKVCFQRRAINQMTIDLKERNLRTGVYNPLTNQGLYEKDDLRVLIDYLSGVSIPEISKRYSYSMSTIHRRLLMFKKDILDFSEPEMRTVII